LNSPWKSGGRHAAPSHVVRCARIAVPVAATAGALTAVVTAGGAPVTQIVAPAAVAQAPAPAAHTGPRVYVVRPGDTLAGIAQRFYGRMVAWPWLWHVNRGQIGGDPGVLQAGRVLEVPRHHPVSYRAWPPPPPPAPPAPARVAVYAPRRAEHLERRAAPESFSNGGMYSETGLERVWMSAGGSAATAPHAACIAEHESGGNPRAISPQDDAGLWQIASSNAPTGEMLDPGANAAKAVQMSSGGRDWSAWSTAGDC